MLRGFGMLRFADENGLDPLWLWFEGEGGEAFAGREAKSGFSLRFIKISGGYPNLAARLRSNLSA